MPSDTVRSPGPDDGRASASGHGDGSSPSSVGVRAVPYAVPVAAGIALVAWSVPELLRILGTYYGKLPHLAGAAVGLTVGSALLLFGGAGALAAVMRASARA